MMRVRSLSVLGILVIAACAEPPVTPSSVGKTISGPVLASANSGSSDRYLINFKNNQVSADLAGRVAALGGTVEAAYDGVGVAVVVGLTATGAASLSDLGDVGSDETFQILDPNMKVEVEAVADAVSPSSSSDPTTASRYARQWDMRQIKANVAWAAGKRGSSSVKVAIVDTGIDDAYPDLQGRVDLANSKSFVPSDDALVASLFPSRHVTTDLHFHGTHVAMTVASNSNILAGVTTQTMLMAVKVIGVSGSGSISGILAGIVYAADQGANVINMSLGIANLPFDMHNKDNKDFFNKVVDRAFQYAHSKGVTVVVAAGNESQNLDVKQSYKPFCGSKHVICVSATGPTAGGTNGPWTNPDAFAFYSNFGLNQIDVAAPGGNSGGSVWSGCSTTSLQIPVCQTGTFIVNAIGTSMASPHVAGLAALLAAEQNGRASGAIRSSIFNADDLGDPGNDARYGNGRINVARALGLE